jgi:hypothetical protein
VLIAVDGVPGDNAVQTITRPPGTTGGTFTLTFMGATTAPLPSDAAANQVRDALAALETIPGPEHLRVTQLATGWQVEFTGHLAATDVPLLEADSSNLSGDLALEVEEIQAAVAVNEQQLITLPPETTGGSFRLRFDDGAFVLQTAPVPFDASAADVQAALQAIPTIGSGNVQVTGDAGGPWTAEFVGALRAMDLRPMEIDGSGLAGGLEADVEIVRAPAGTDAVQRVQLPLHTIDGTFTFTFQGFTTDPIDHDASAGAVQAALEALDSIGPDNVLVDRPGRRSVGSGVRRGIGAERAAAAGGRRERIAARWRPAARARGRGGSRATCCQASR